MDKITHKCFWCNEDTDSMFWACHRCSPLKEEGYRRAAERKTNNILDVYECVFEVLKEHGVEVKNDK